MKWLGFLAIIIIFAGFAYVIDYVAKIRNSEQ